MSVQLAECTEDSEHRASTPTPEHQQADTSVQVQPACFPEAPAGLEQPLGIRELVVAAGDP